MVAYTIINGTAAELTNVNVGGTDVAAYTISNAVTLTDAELATVAALNGVAVMQTLASGAEQYSVANVMITGGGSNPAAAYNYDAANGTGSAVTAESVTVDAQDVVLNEPMSATEVFGLLVDGVVVRITSTDDVYNEPNKVALRLLMKGGREGGSAT